MPKPRSCDTRIEREVGLLSMTSACETDKSSSGSAISQAPATIGPLGLDNKFCHLFVIF